MPAPQPLHTGQPSMQRGHEPAGRGGAAARLHRVVAHIDGHLDQPLNLAQLAEAAHLSRYHFHRVFAAWAGQTLGDYLWRRRVEVAAVKLATQPRLAVRQVALSVGFGSGEALAHAFKQRFGMSASAWRRLRQADRLQQLSKLDQVPGGPVGQHATMRTAPALDTIRVMHLPPAPVACLRYQGETGDAVGRFWRDTAAPWLQAQGLTGRTCYGVLHDDPAVVDPGLCRYDAAVQWPSPHKPPPPAWGWTLPGGRYAVLPFRGRSDQIGSAWDVLLRDWLPDSGWQLDSRPCFERYPAAECDAPDLDGFACDICIPVGPL